MAVATSAPCVEGTIPLWLDAHTEDDVKQRCAYLAEDQPISGGTGHATRNGRRFLSTAQPQIGKKGFLKEDLMWGPQSIPSTYNPAT